MKDKNMICRMAGNIAGPLLASATTVGNRSLANCLSEQEISDTVGAVAALSILCAHRIYEIADKDIK